jgi:hypothetical protein
MDDKDARIVQLERALDKFQKEHAVMQDRQDIYDCLVRYCRGIDRSDPELMMSAYHPDALDDHGVICTTAAEFVAWALAVHKEGQLRTQHFLGPCTFDIQGDVADTETYWHYSAFNKPPLDPVTMMGGRYLDRLERRNGRWAIAHRVCVYDWHGKHQDRFAFPVNVMDGQFNAGFMPTRDKNDPSYKRPYAVDPARLGYLMNPAQGA